MKDGEKPEGYPFTLPFLSGDFELAFRSPITFFVGENGAGKSTLLEAIARNCGFHAAGGSRDNVYQHREKTHALDEHLSFSWLPRISTGFFFRAETFRNFADYVDDEAGANPGLPALFGGSAHARSHGEAFLDLFEKRLGASRPAIYLLDEPEAALSPTRQERFLGLLEQWAASSVVQIVIATHAPILMSYPGATILRFGRDIAPCDFHDTDHYLVTRKYLG